MRVLVTDEIFEEYVMNHNKHLIEACNYVAICMKDGTVKVTKNRNGKHGIISYTEHIDNMSYYIQLSNPNLPKGSGIFA